MKVFGVIIILIVCANANECPPWSYSGLNGPLFWGRLVGKIDYCYSSLYGIKL